MYEVSVFYINEASNLGDLAINVGEIEFLNKIFKDTMKLNLVIYSTKNSKKQYRNMIIESFKNYNIDNINEIMISNDKIPIYLNNFDKFLQDTGSADSNIFLISSGEFLFNYHEKPNLNTLFWRLLPIIIAKNRGKKTLMFPNTLGPFENSEVKHMVNNIFKLSNNLCVRDQESIQFLDSNFEINLNLDPAYYIKVNKYEDFDNVTKHCAIIMRADDWGIRISDENLKKSLNRNGKEYNKNSLSYDFMKTIINKYLEEYNNHQIVLYVQTKNDLKLANNIKKNMENENILIVYPKNIEEYISYLSKSSFVISSRFHGIILSHLANQYNCFGIYYKTSGHKMLGLFKMFDIENRCNLIDHSNIISVVNNIFSLIEEDTSNKSKIFFEKIEKIREKSYSDFENSLKKINEISDSDIENITKEFYNLFKSELINN
jgi:polysaccharide pyruvyl transferase WcaK-like protein